MMTEDFDSTHSAPSGRKSIPIILIGMAMLGIALVFFVSLTYFRSLEQETAISRASLYQRSLNETLIRFQHLPYVLAQDPELQNVLDGKSNASLNRKLANFSIEAKLEAIYLMDDSGLVVAASNYDQSFSFLGQNYSFRPYFTQAIAEKRGNYFGVGATTGRPGYFVAEPVRNASGRAVGVIAIKLDASELQKSWEDADENVLATNPDGIVVLASKKQWLYRFIGDLSALELAAIAESKQFGNVKLERLSWALLSPSSVELENETYTLAIADADYLGWKVNYLLGQERAYERTILATTVFGSMIALLMGFAAYLRSKRIQVALTASQSDRRNLVNANRQLEHAQAALAKSTKLAALGQLSASVVHELGQPIAALKNYLTAEEISSDQANLPTLQKIKGVVNRMENITKQLRFFIKPGEEAMQKVLIDDVVSGCLELTQHEIDNQGVHLRTDLQAQTSVVEGNLLRLEQVLVNLVKNSLASLRDASATELSITSLELDSHVHIIVQDNGTGFGDRNIEILQEPFYTTRASGDGMGLGLSISAAIIKEHEGTLVAENLPSGGAKFTLALPLLNTGSENIDE